MGKKHRQQRKLAKLIIFRHGYRETELGELKQTMSKAEARMRRAHRILLRLRAEREILEALQERSVRDIQAIEDASVFGVPTHSVAP